MELLVEVDVPGDKPWLCRGERRSDRRLRLNIGAFELGLPGDEVRVTLLDEPAASLTAEVLWAAHGAAEVLLTAGQRQP